MWNPLQGDRFSRPFGDRLVRGDDKYGRGTLVAVANGGDVERPGEPFSAVACELYLDDDRVDGLLVLEQDEEVGAVLGGHRLGEVGLARGGAGVVRKFGTEHAGDELGREGSS